MYKLDAKDLKEFAKTQKDVDKNKSRLPAQEYLVDDGLLDSTAPSESTDTKQTWEYLEEYKSSE